MHCAATPDAQEHAIGRPFADRANRFARARHRFAIRFDDDIAGLKTSRRGGRIGIDLDDDRALHVIRNVELLTHAPIDIGNGHAIEQIS
jgi:hypothetical protein